MENFPVELNLNVKVLDKTIHTGGIINKFNSETIVNIFEKGKLSKINTYNHNYNVNVNLKENVNIQDEFDSKFSEVFKTITSYNGSELSNLSNIENYCSTKVYFTYPYSFF